MKKLFFLTACALTLSFISFSQTTEKNLNFCKQYFRAEGLLQLAIKYKDQSSSIVFADEANKAATRAENALTEIESAIKTKVSKEELQDLKASIKFIKDRTEEGLDENSIPKVALWLQLVDRKLSKIFPKLMK